MTDKYNLKDRHICYLPFIRLNIKKHDGLFPCCLHWIENKSRVEEYREPDVNKFDTYFQSEKAREFRKKILNHDFSHCLNCPNFIQRDERFFTAKNCVDHFGEYGQKIVDAFETGDFSEPYPYRFEVAYDISCNLSCITCRDDVITKVDIPKEFNDKVIEYAKHCHSLNIAGDGEALFSKNYMSILSSDLSGHELKEIMLMTNAILLPKQWSKIHPNTRKLIKSIKISIDASSKELFETIRKGAKWEMLLESLEFLKNLHDTEGIQLETTYTISKYNYKDIINFPAFIEPYNFSAIIFNFADTEFRLNEFMNGIELDHETKEEILTIIEILKKTSKINIY